MIVEMKRKKDYNNAVEIIDLIQKQYISIDDLSAEEFDAVMTHFAEKAGIQKCIGDCNRCESQPESCSSPFLHEPIVTDRPVHELSRLIENKSISLSDLSSSEMDAMMEAVISAVSRNGRCAMCDTCSLSDNCHKLRGMNHG